MTVRYGTEGYGVTLLQYALMRAGMDVGNQDGICGRRTVRALQQFQRDHGLAADGIAGKLTWAALYPYITGYTIHRIVPEDTFPLLAERYGTTVGALKTANPILATGATPVGRTITVPLDLSVVTGSIFASSLLIGLLAKGLAMRYPYVSVYEIGRSGMGRPILALSMGEGKKQVGYVGAHHADAWSTTQVLLSFLEAYAAAYATGRSFGGVSSRELYERTTLHMAPLVNPDGVDLITGALDAEDSFYAQAQALASYYPDIPFPEGWQSNIFGVDLSVQYPSRWEIARRDRSGKGYTRPGPRGYAGSEPLIAPETRAIARWTKERDFALTMSFDEGYRDWIVQNWHRPGHILETGGGPLLVPVLTRGLTLSS